MTKEEQIEVANEIKSLQNEFRKAVHRATARKPKMTDPVQVKCYGKWDSYKTRKAAMDFYFECMLGSEGCERDRYTNVYCKLKEGFRKCTDDLDTTSEDEM